jgi:hypothetical protein
MFDAVHAHHLWLAQPALAPGSHVSHHITQQVSGVRLRYTSFVEVMCPLFSRSGLARLAHSFRESVSGWGLDFLWPYLLGYPKDRIAVLDETPVLHTRPVGGGGTYAWYAEHRVKPPEEAGHILDKYGLRPPPFHTYASLLE